MGVVRVIGLRDEGELVWPKPPLDVQQMRVHPRFVLPRDIIISLIINMILILIIIIIIGVHECEGVAMEINGPFLSVGVVCFLSRQYSLEENVEMFTKANKSPFNKQLRLYFQIY